MKKRGALALLLWAAMALLLTGCLFRPPDELYRRPERSAGYDQLAAAIRSVKTGLEGQFGVSCEDAVIVAGDNTASIPAPGPGRGRPAGERRGLYPGARRRKVAENLYLHRHRRGLSGPGSGGGGTSAIYSVDYVDLNGAGSKELVVNWQVNTGVYQLGAYTLDELELEPAADAAALPQNQLADRASLRATELLLTSCSTAMEGGAYSSGYRLLDIDQDTRTEVAVVRLDAAALSGQVELYGWRNGRMESLSTTALSAGITGLNRVTAGYLAGTYYPPALYITCAQSDGSRTTDVVAYQPGGHEGEMHLVNLALNDHGVSRERLRGTAELGPSDVNNDVVLELPQVRMLPQDRTPAGPAPGWWTGINMTRAASAAG